MSTKSSSMKVFGSWLYWVLIVILAFPYEILSPSGNSLVTPPVALFLGLMFAFVFGIPHPKFNKKLSK